MFRGSFDAHAAASVFDEPYDKAVDSLGLLLDHSLIEFDNKTSRYSQNELVKLHAYKTGSTASPDQMKVWKTRFINYYVNYLTASDHIDPSAKTNVYLLESANLEACLEYANSLENKELADKVVNVGANFLNDGVQRKRYEKQAKEVLSRSNTNLKQFM